MTQAEAAKKISEAEGDAQSAINGAKGEAESNRIRLDSLTPQMLELRKLENQRALIEWEWTVAHGGIGRQRQRVTFAITKAVERRGNVRARPLLSRRALLDFSREVAKLRAKRAPAARAKSKTYSATVSSTVEDDATRAPGVGV
jgi:hypothetical protein